MLLSFEKLHEYQLVEETKIETGDGAMYQALDLELGRTVAVKQVGIAGETPRLREENYQAALREVRAMVRIGEKTMRVPRLYATHFDPKSSQMYIVMEWIPGKTLEQMMCHCSPRQFLSWMADLCEILAQMASLGIYHKDIKPSNIMIVRDKLLYLIDFNISLSLPNAVEGTPFYKAPEMDPGSKFSGRDKVDMFSIGVMLYEFFTKKRPKRGDDYATSFFSPNKWSHFVRAAEAAQGVPKQVDDIIFKCMQLDPKKRYDNMPQLQAAIREAVRNYGK